MKAVAKITSKGQITLPKEVRRELGVDTGDSVVFETLAGEPLSVKPMRTTSPFAQYRGIGNPGIPGGSVEEIIRYVREMRGHDPDEEEWEEAYALTQGKASQAKKSA